MLPLLKQRRLPANTDITPAGGPSSTPFPSGRPLGSTAGQHSSRARKSGWRKPRRGLTVAILGPDGAGKSTLTRNLSAVSPVPMRTVYMGGNPESAPTMLPTTRLLVRYGKWKTRGDVSGTGTSGTPRTAKSTIAGRLALGARETVKFLNELLEYSYRFVTARAAARRGEVVVFDRYVYDAWIDAIADRASAWRWMRAVILRYLFPRPDMLLVLEAPPEMLFARKGEHTPERLERVQAACRVVAKTFKRVGYIDASQSPKQVLDEAMAHIGKHLYARNAYSARSRKGN